MFTPVAYWKRIKTKQCSLEKRSTDDFGDNSLRVPPNNCTSLPQLVSLKAWQNEETCFRNYFLVLPCFHAARKDKMFLPCGRSKFCILETKLTL